MDPLFLLSTAAVVTAMALLTATAFLNVRTTRKLRLVRSRQISAVSKLQKSRMDLMETRNRARLLEDTFKNGTSAVEKVHKSITTTTFSLIDRFSTNEEFRENARKARETHDQTSNRIYRSLHTTNRALHILADTLLISKKEKKLNRRKPPEDGQ